MSLTTNGPQVSLIIPVLNREERLQEVIGKTETVLRALNAEIVVVYDVTRQDLLGAVRAEQEMLWRRCGVRSITRLGRRGFGNALRAGADTSTGRVIVPVMGDDSDDLMLIPRMLEQIALGADLVAGRRYGGGGRIVGNSAKQRLSRLYCALMTIVSAVPCRDVSNSFKAYRREIWDRIPSAATSFDISVEMTVKAAAQGYRLTEVSAVWTNRQQGRSHFQMLREAPNYGRWLLHAMIHVPSRRFLFAVFGMLALLTLGGAMLWVAARRSM